MIAACGGGGAPKSDTDAVAQVLRDAAQAVAKRDGGKACGHLTEDAQRQVQLQFGTGPLGNTDCGTLVNRATFALSPLERTQIENLEPSNIQVNGDSASATMSTQSGAPNGQGPSVQLNLRKDGDDWKISGFQNVDSVAGF